MSIKEENTVKVLYDDISNNFADIRRLIGNGRLIRASNISVNCWFEFNIID